MRRRALLLATAALHGAAGAVRSELWPDRPLRLIVAYPPGGVSDETARLLAQGLSLRLKVPALVDNRAGAGGAIALDQLSRAPPDGNTLAYCAISPLVFAPHLDPQRGVTPVISIMDTPVLLLAHPGFKPNTLAEVLALARRAPGQVRWATSGPATVGQRVLEQLMQASGVEITHVPYKGGSQPLIDALSGQFEMLSSNVAGPQLQYLKQGRLKALAVGAPTRLAVLPDVPTLAELGYRQANLVSTFGIFVPQGTATERVALLNRALNSVLLQPEINSRLRAVSNLPTGGSPADFARRIAEERLSQR